MTKLEGCRAVCDPEDFFTIKDMLPSKLHHLEQEVIEMSA